MFSLIEEADFITKVTQIGRFKELKQKAKLLNHCKKVRRLLDHGRYYDGE
jgi:hypothetical protein